MGDLYKNLDDFLMTFALANYEWIPSVWDPVDSVWWLAVASRLIEQKACFWKVLGLLTSRASGTGERYSDNVVVFWVVSPWSLVAWSLRGCFVPYRVIKLVYSLSGKCLCVVIWGGAMLFPKAGGSFVALFRFTCTLCKSQSKSDQVLIGNWWHLS